MSSAAEDRLSWILGTAYVLDRVSFVIMLMHCFDLDRNRVVTVPEESVNTGCFRVHL